MIVGRLSQHWLSQDYSIGVVGAIGSSGDLYGLLERLHLRGLIQRAVRVQPQEDSQANPPHSDVSVQLASTLKDILNQRQISFETQLRVQFIEGDDIPLEEDVPQQDLGDSAEGAEVVGADSVGKLSNVLAGLDVHLNALEDEGKDGPVGSIRAPAFRCGEGVVTSLEEIIDDVIEELLVQIEVAGTRVYNCNIGRGGGQVHSTHCDAQQAHLPVLIPHNRNVLAAVLNALGDLIEIYVRLQGGGLDVQRKGRRLDLVVLICHVKEIRSGGVAHPYEALHLAGEFHVALLRDPQILSSDVDARSGNTKHVRPISPCNSGPISVLNAARAASIGEGGGFGGIVKARSAGLLSGQPQGIAAGIELYTHHLRRRPHLQIYIVDEVLDIPEGHHRTVITQRVGLGVHLNRRLLLHAVDRQHFGLSEHDDGQQDQRVHFVNVIQEIIPA